MILIIYKFKYMINNKLRFYARTQSTHIRIYWFWLLNAYLNVVSATVNSWQMLHDPMGL